MKSNLETFLARHKPLVERSEIWGEGTISLRIRNFITGEFPPHEYITSVKSFVLQKDQVLVVRNPQGVHLLPGGRIENGETFIDTIQREIIEETGWTISNLVLIGFTHFHHLTPKPEGYQYPYPDFIQLNYMAEAVEHLKDSKILDDYVIDSQFYPLSEIHSLVSKEELTHLRSALIVYRGKFNRNH